MKILFFGSPHFAVPCLESLHHSEHEVLAVITKPDRPSGRGRVLKGTEVKKWCVRNHVDVIQPEKIRSEQFIRQLKEFRADLFIVVGFPILPQAIIDIPPRGAINVHASLLPAYRGAAPIQWALINGEKETGITVFYLARKVDTGNIILQKKAEVTEDDTSETLHNKLLTLGREALQESVALIAAGNVKSRPQTGEVSRAPKITPEMPLIHWDMPAQQVHNRIRAFSPRPGAYTFLNGKRIKIFSSSVVATQKDPMPPGSILECTNDSVVVCCARDCIEFREIQIQGKKRMAVADFLRGCSLRTGDRFYSYGQEQES